MNGPRQGTLRLGDTSEDRRPYTALRQWRSGQVDSSPRESHTCAEELGVVDISAVEDLLGARPQALNCCKAPRLPFSTGPNGPEGGTLMCPTPHLSGHWSSMGGGSKRLDAFYGQGLADSSAQARSSANP